MLPRKRIVGVATLSVACWLGVTVSTGSAIAYGDNPHSDSPNHGSSASSPHGNSSSHSQSQGNSSPGSASHGNSSDNSSSANGSESSSDTRGPQPITQTRQFPGNTTRPFDNASENSRFRPPSQPTEPGTGTTTPG